MKVTIKHIAKLADVSTATISKVVNHKDENISEQTRARVLAIIKEEGYVPNRIASSMVTKTTKSLGLIIPDITNPFFPVLARGVEDAANDHGYNVIFCNTDNNLRKEELYFEMLQEKMVDGIIFTVASQHTSLDPVINRINIPIVSVDRKIEGIKEEAIVKVDNEGGAFDAVCYLIERGYKAIYHIAGPMSIWTSTERYRGYLRAHKEKDVEVLVDHIMEGEFTTEWGYEAAKKLILNKVKFDSILCGNDLIALGVYKAFHELGINIPEDIAVVGYDDIYMAGMLVPELTTVRQPAYEMGYKAAELVIKYINHEVINKHDYELKTEFIVRGSTK